MRVEESRCVDEECCSKGQTEEKSTSFKLTVKVERDDETEIQGTQDNAVGRALGNGKVAVINGDGGHSWPAEEDDDNSEDAHTRTTEDASPPQTCVDALPAPSSTATSTVEPSPPPQRPRMRRWWSHKMPTLHHLNTHADAHPPPPVAQSERTLGTPRGTFSAPGIRGFLGGLWGHYRSRGGQRVQRSSHQQLWTRGKRRFPCGYCEKSFDRLSHLDRHRRIHTGERPYGCSICGRRFTQKSSLKGHLRTHRGKLQWQ